MTKLFLPNYFWFICFLPFIQPFPFPSDLQPLCPLIGLIILIRSSFKISKLVTPILFLFLIAVFTWINPFLGNSFLLEKTYLLKIASIPAALIIYNCTNNLIGYLRPKHVYATTFIYFLAFVFRNISPFWFVTIQDYFVNKTNVTLNSLAEYLVRSNRDIGILSTEPAFTAACCATLIVTALWFLQSSSKYEIEGNYINRLEAKLLTISILINILLIIGTKSLSGYVYLFLIFLPKIGSLVINNIRLLLNLTKNKIRVSRNNLLIISIFPILLATVLYFINFNTYNLNINSRLIQGLSVLFNTPEKIYQIDGGRVEAIITNTKIFLSQPITGYGFEFPDLYKIYQASGEYVTNKGSISTITYFPAATGFLSLVAFYLLIKQSRSPIYAKFLSLCFLTVSFSLAFPPIWVLLSLRPDRKK